MHSRMGILLANTGTPSAATPPAVKEYLAQFLSNGRIVPLPGFLWAPILHGLVLPVRSRSSARKYATVEALGRSSFIADHEKLADMLKARLNGEGRDIVVRCAMSFGQPTIANEVDFLRGHGCDELVVLPLYPQNAFSQASIVADEVARIAAQAGFEGKWRVIGDYSANERYLSAVVDTVTEAGFDAACDRLLMSFHSIPRTDVEQGDTYEGRVLATCAQLRARLGGDERRIALGFQSRFDKPRKWLDPFSCDIVRAWAVDPSFEGRLFVVCPNFSFDCLETRYDVQIELDRVWREACRASGRGGDNPLVYVECLGPTERHVDVIVDVLESAGLEFPAKARGSAS